MSTNETYTHLDEVLRAAMQIACRGLGTEDPDNLNLSKGPHSKNISIDDWNTLVNQVEISSKDVERLYSLLTELVKGLGNSALQIRVPAEPDNDTDATSKKYTDDLIKDITGFKSTDAEGFGIFGNIAGLLDHVLHHTAHDIKLSVSKTEDDYKLTAELFEEKPEKGDAKAISTYTVSLSGFVDPIISKIIDRINSKEAYVLSYELLEDKSGYLCTGKGKAILKNIEIASKIDGKPVVAVASEAFKDWDTVESITIPSSVNTIGKGAFKGCCSLKSLTVPFVGISRNSVDADTLFGNMFHETDPKDDSLYYMANQSHTWREAEGGSKNFWIPKSLKSVTVTGGKLSWGMFQNLSHVQHIDVSNIATDTLSKFLFHQCGALTDLRLPISIKTIEQGALAACAALKSIEISNTLKTVGDAAFADCTSLEALDFTSSKLTTLAPNSFKGCTKLTSIVIPSSVTAIGQDSFKGCSNLVIYCAASAKPKDWDKGWASTDPLAIYWNGTRLDTIVKSIYAEDDIDLVKFTDTVKNVFHKVAIETDPTSEKYGVITFEQLGGGTKEIDLPLELLISTDPELSYYDSGKEILFIGLANGKQIEIPLGDILDAVDAAVKTAQDAAEEAIAAKESAESALEGANAALASANSAVDAANAAKTEANAAKTSALEAAATAEGLAESLSDSLNTVGALKPMLYNALLGPDIREAVNFKDTGEPDEENLKDIFPNDSVVGGSEISDLVAFQAAVLGTEMSNVYAVNSTVLGTDVSELQAHSSTVSGNMLRNVYAKYSVVTGYDLGKDSDTEVDSLPVEGAASINVNSSVVAGFQNESIIARYSVVAGLGQTVQNLEGGIIAGNYNKVYAPSDGDGNRMTGLAVFGTWNCLYNSQYSVVSGTGNTIGDSDAYVSYAGNTRNNYNAVFGKNNTVNSQASLIAGEDHIVARGRDYPPDRRLSYCLVAGLGHYATAYYQTLVGRYSNASSTTLFAVGNGTKDSSTGTIVRSNAFEVRYDSNSGTSKMYLDGKEYGVDSVTNAVNAQTATEAKQFTGTAYVTSGGTSTNALNTVIADLDKRLKNVGFKQGVLELSGSDSQDGKVGIDLNECTLNYFLNIGLLHIPAGALNLDNSGDYVEFKMFKANKSAKINAVGTVQDILLQSASVYAYATLSVSGEFGKVFVSKDVGGAFGYDYTNDKDIDIWFTIS